MVEKYVSGATALGSSAMNGRAGLSPTPPALPLNNLVDKITAIIDGIVADGGINAVLQIAGQETPVSLFLKLPGVKLTALCGAKPETARSGEWPRVRREHLSHSPECAACGCGESEFLDVHHVYPVHLVPARELDPSNLITLCESPSHNCHFIFGHLLDWHSYNANVGMDAPSYDEDIKYRPYDVIVKGT